MKQLLDNIMQKETSFKESYFFLNKKSITNNHSDDFIYKRFF